MNRRTRILLGVSAIVFLGILAAILVPFFIGGTELELRVRDAVSRRWVWDLTMRLQDRELRSFYQSDAGLRVFRFTRLRPGKSTLEISAPGYRPLSVPVMLHRGANRLGAPLDLVGREIPGLGGFLMFESLDGSDIVAQVRPVGKATSTAVNRGAGGAILNHPCLDLRVGCRVFVQMTPNTTGPGAPFERQALADARGDRPYRGRELFRGSVPWTWDPSPEASFRYSARIEGARMKPDPSALRVIDYLVVVPDPLKITAAEMDSLMARVETLDDPAAVRAALDAEKEKIRWFTDTSWNVRAAQE
jgi:hypothetical protein